MYVLAPYTTHHPEAAAALSGTDHDVHHVRLEPHRARDYFDVLADVWQAGETVAIVEHDIVVHATALDDLSACPHDWCAFPYQYMEHERHYGLGCVKFSADLLARCPDAMRRVGVLRDPTHPPRHWCRLDAWLQGVVLPSMGETMHKHDTPVRHLGHGNSHGCIH